MQSEEGGSEQSDNPQQIQSSEPIDFGWETKWLKGHQYAFILRNVDKYCQKYGFVKYAYKTHPIDIYENPKNGMIYFVEGNGVGTDFGFPRVTIKKRFRWKKMNFTTDLPKKNPQVTYVVASAVKPLRMDHNDYPLYRMHAVVLHEENCCSQSYILCHVREMQRKKSIDQLSNCFLQKNTPHFYKLFAYIHNLQIHLKNITT